MSWVLSCCMNASLSQFSVVSLSFVFSQGSNMKHGINVSNIIVPMCKIAIVQPACKLPHPVPMLLFWLSMPLSAKKHLAETSTSYLDITPEPAMPSAVPAESTRLQDSRPQSRADSAASRAQHLCARSATPRRRPLESSPGPTGCSLRVLPARPW